MLDNLSLTYEPNDEDDNASAYEIYTDPRDTFNTPVYVGNVIIDERHDSASALGAEGIAMLFANSPQLLASVRAFVGWALRQPPRPRPNLDPIVAEARALLARLA